MEQVVELIAPVTVEEVTAALKDANDGSPGVDGITRAYVRSMGQGPGARDMAAHMTLWLCAQRPPSAFKVGITSLIPKSADSVEPKDFRPITMSSMLCRQFHRILAARFEQHVPLSPRQKAFKRGDGLVDNAVILRSLLKDHCAKSRSVCVAFIDVAKAFDSVSHDYTLVVCRRMGIPEVFVEYIRRLYDGGTITRRCGRQRDSRTFTVRRGVRQGDPLSPFLFNLVMDWLLSMLDENLGVEEATGVRDNHLDFADDLALISETPEGLKALAREYEALLGSVGLRSNAGK